MTITEPDVRIDGDNADYYAKEDTKTVTNASFRVYSSHLRGTSCKLKAVGKDLMYLPKGSFSTCAPDSNAWYIKAKRIKLSKETGRGEAWHTKLYVKDVPVFYWPYVNFPIDNRRQTGFLFPEFKSSSNYGPND